MNKIICVAIAVIAAFAMMLFVKNNESVYPYVYADYETTTIPVSDQMPLSFKLFREYKKEKITVKLYEGKNIDEINGKTPIAEFSYAFDAKNASIDIVRFVWDTPAQPGSYITEYYSSYKTGDDWHDCPDRYYSGFRVVNPCADHTYEENENSIYGVEGVKPDCHNRGTAYRLCKVCGYEESYELEPSHVYGNGVTISNATCVDVGYKTYECTRCGETKVELIEAESDKHRIRAVVKVEPTATLPGSVWFECSSCNYVEPYNTEIPPLLMEIDPALYYEKPAAWAYNNELFKRIKGYKFEPDEPCDRATAFSLMYLANGVGVTADDVNPYDDVSNGDYFRDAAKWAYKYNVLGGGSFKPYESCTRGMIIESLWRMAGSPAVRYTHDFTDVPEDASYNDAVSWAVSEGIADGMDDGVFNPDLDCTQAQVVTFLYRVMDGKDVE